MMQWRNGWWGGACMQFIALYMKADLDNVTNVHAPPDHNWCLTVRDGRAKPSGSWPPRASGHAPGAKAA